MEIEKKYLTKEERQACSLKLLKCFDAFCSSHSIRYSLSGGTLLGAIRHNGFIPWDDDIDVELPRPDYNRFVMDYKDPQGRYKCYAPEIGNSMITYARLCDMVDTGSIPYCPWCKENTGIYIDIFPVDALPDDYNEFAETSAKLHRLVFYDLYYSRGATVQITRDLGFKRIIRILGKRLVYGRKDIEERLKTILDILGERDYSNAHHVGQVAYPMYWKGKFFDKDIYDSYTRVKFEDSEFSAVSQYDLMLKGLYGDYMELPPVEKRVPAHTEHLIYWR